MIWVVRFDIVGHETVVVPSVGDIASIAIMKADRILPFGWKIRDVETESFPHISEVSADHMRYSLNAAMRTFWAVAFDLANDHEGLHFHGNYHAAVDHYIETSEVLWEV